MSLQRKYKYIKNTMAAGIAQKSYKAHFHGGILRKRNNGNSKIKHYAKVRLKALERALIMK